MYSHSEKRNTNAFGSTKIYINGKPTQGDEDSSLTIKANTYNRLQFIQKYHSFSLHI